MTGCVLELCPAFSFLILALVWPGRPKLGCLGGLVSLLSNGRSRAYYGLLWKSVGDTDWTYEVN